MASSISASTFSGNSLRQWIPSTYCCSWIHSITIHVIIFYKSMIISEEFKARLSYIQKFEEQTWIRSVPRVPQMKFNKKIQTLKKQVELPLGRFCLIMYQPPQPLSRSSSSSLPLASPCLCPLSWLSAAPALAASAFLTFPSSMRFLVSTIGSGLAFPAPPFLTLFTGTILTTLSSESAPFTLLTSDSSPASKSLSSSYWSSSWGGAFLGGTTGAAEWLLREAWGLTTALSSSSKAKAIVFGVTVIILFARISQRVGTTAKAALDLFLWVLGASEAREASSFTSQKYNSSFISLLKPSIYLSWWKPHSIKFSNISCLEICTHLLQLYYF